MIDLKLRMDKSDDNISTKINDVKVKIEDEIKVEYQNISLPSKSSKLTAHTEHKSEPRNTKEKLLTIESVEMNTPSSNNVNYATINKKDIIKIMNKDKTISEMKMSDMKNLKSRKKNEKKNEMTRNKQKSITKAPVIKS